MHVIEKAQSIINNKWIRKTDETNKSIWFLVQSVTSDEHYIVSLDMELGGIKVTCECKWFVYHPDRLCSHGLSALYFMLKGDSDGNKEI